jgi:hypothetical protein
MSLHGDDSILGSQADRYANERLDQISDDKLSVNAPQDESPQDKDNRWRHNHRRHNRRRAAHRRNATTRAQQAPAQHEPRDLQRNFDEAADNVFSPVINLAEAAILMQSLPDSPAVRQIQRLTRDALHQIDKQQNPVPSASRNSLLGTKKINKQAKGNARVVIKNQGIKMKVIMLVHHEIAIAMILVMRVISSTPSDSDDQQTKPTVFQLSVRI